MKALLFFSLLLAPFFAWTQNPFKFQNIFIPPGTKKHFKIPVVDNADSTFIPVTLFHGAKSGPVLGITAGIHGYEYPPILAAQQLQQQIDLQQLSGTIILVQVANIPAFLGRSPYLNPLDGKNLNRSFPGTADGSITERMAHLITTEVIAKSNFFIDMHGGDAPEDLHSYNAWYQSDALPEVSKKGKEMALAMGFTYAIAFNISKERLAEPSRYCSQEAFHRNIPSVDIECGRLGTSGKTEIIRIVHSIFSVVKHLKMTTQNHNTPSLVTPTVITQRSTVKSTSTGLFYTEKKAGDLVKKGELVGTITDFFGNNIENIKASQNGIILYMIGTPPINKGETLLNIGSIP